MNQFLAIPIEPRLALLFLVGVLVAGFVNLATYTLAWNPRAISPWSAAPPNTRRRWTDRLPLFGWWALRRESALHGRGFWIRPLAVELGLGTMLALLYWWEAWQGGLLGAPLVGAPLPGAPLAPLVEALHAEYLAHALLVVLMLVASLIDIDEKTIPDSIVVPGTLAALILASVLPSSALPCAAWLPAGAGAIMVELMTLSSPHPWPAELAPAPQAASLWLALGCWGYWCFALLPRVWKTSRGLKMAWRIFWHRLLHSWSVWATAVMGPVGAGAIYALWRFGSADSWIGLVNALVGLAAGATIIWAVRVVGGMVLKKEAMGFGDVTLLGMIGAYLGWQAALVVFFLSPFAGVLLAVGQWIVNRKEAIPFGPFLCLAAFGVILGWAEIWASVEQYFEAGWLVPAAVAVCVVMLGVLLGLWRLIRHLVFGPEKAAGRTREL